MSKFTRKRIMDAYLYLLNKTSLDKLTVKDIIETADVNRNTFYYYFEDIYDLQHKVFQKKFEDFCEGSSQQTSFYDEYIRAAEFVLNNKKAMEHIYYSKDRELIQTYMEHVTTMFVENFVRKAASASSYNLSEQGVEYLTSFYCNAIVGYTMHWIKEGMPPYREKSLLLISESFENSIDSMIQTFINFENTQL